MTNNGKPVPDRIRFADGVAVLEPYRSEKWPSATTVKTILPSVSLPADVEAFQP
jgi:hypothetical protein